jgi:micrococcal nuclease
LTDLLKSAKQIIIRTEKPDSTEKYGRILGWMFIDGESESVNASLVAKGYAWDYMGETKVKDFELLKRRREKGAK